MKLTKKHIKYIDKRLKNSGMKYWDIRLEFIDHIVNEIESKITEEEQFKSAVQNSLINLGWKGNLKELNTKSWKNVGKKYRRKYIKEFLEFFKKAKKLLLLITTFLFYFWLSKKLELQVFRKLSYLLILLPILIVFIKYVKVLMKKYRKSINIDYGITYFSMAFIILQGIPMLFSSTTETTQKTVWLIILPIYYIATYSGYKVFKDALNKVEVLIKSTYETN